MSKQDRPIQKLQKHVSDQITSQQIIPTLHQCIKQLIDNSIDAKATIIKIQLEEYGKIKFSVFDNGMGIKQVQKLGQAGNTSKLKIDSQKVEDYLEGIRTLGFRGQAVNSIATLCKQMTILTLFKEDFNNQQKKTLTQTKYSVTKRIIIQKKQSFSSETFTKVTIEGLFHTLPVRKYQLDNKPKQNIKKVYDLVFQISLIYPETTFIFVNSVEDKEEIVFEIQRSNSQKIKRQTDTEVSFFNQYINKQAWKERIQICFPQKLEGCLAFVKSDNVEGFILNTIDSGSSKKNLKFSKNLQYTFINRRPVNPLKQICKLFDGYYKKYNPYTKYLFFLNLRVEPSEIDVNLSPNKRDIFIKKDRLQQILKQISDLIEKEVIEKITNLEEYKEAKLKKLEVQSQKKNAKQQQEEINSNKRNRKKQFQSQQDANVKIRQEVFRSNISESMFEKSLKGNYLANYHKIDSRPQSNTIEELNRRMNGANIGMKSQTLSSIVEKNKKQPKHQNNEQRYEPNSESEQENSKNQEKPIHITQIIQQNKARPININQIKDSIFQTNKQSLLPIKPLQPSFRTQNNSIFPKQLSTEKDQNKNTKSSIKFENYQHRPDPSIILNEVKVQHESFSLKNDLQTQNKHCKKGVDQIKPNKQYCPSRNVNLIQLSNKRKQQKSCQRQFSKSNQSNLAISNQSSYLLKKIQEIQIKNFCPPPNVNYVTQQQQGDITKDNFKKFHIHGQFNKGFILCSFEDLKFMYIIDQHASQEKRLFQSFMESKPMFYYLNKEIQITPLQVDQIEMAHQQLIQSGFTFNIENRATLKILKCPSHFRKNFGVQEFMQIVETNKNIKEIPSFYNSAASKACRSAVMIGDELIKNKMIEIVHRMSDLKSPWNCPHGRPSLISLGGFSSIIGKIKSPKTNYKF